MTPLYLAVVPGRVRFDQLVPDTELFQRDFKQRSLVRTLWIEPIREFLAVICLDALNSLRKAFHTMLNELCG